MQKWNILITDGLRESGQAILHAAAEVEEVSDLEGISGVELLNTLPRYDAMVIRGRTKVNLELIKSATRLKVIGRAGVGVDNIDLAAAQTHQITVVNSPMASTVAVAELTMALMLSLIRKIPRGDAAMKSGQWIKKKLVGSELNGKTLGIIGMGRIGEMVSQRAAVFGMEVLGFDPLLTDETIKVRGAQPAELNLLFRQSDIISLHVPLSPETRNFINGQAIAHMKRGVFLVCAARGGIIAETALLSALESGQVAGAALDVFGVEPPGLTALVAHPNVIATPHIGAQTEEAQLRAASDIAQEVLAALRNEPLRWKVV